MDEALTQWVCQEGRWPALSGLICGQPALWRMAHAHPLVGLTSALLILLALLYFLADSCLRLIRYRWANTAFVGAAQQAQRDLRSRLPAYFPPTPHMLSRDMQGNSAPMACAVCLVPVLNGEDGVFCTVCGAVAHNSCKRRLPKNCKPLVLPPDKSPIHDWRPAGCTLAHVVALVSQGMEGEDEAGQLDGAAQCCLYCNEPCEVGLISLEPVWICSGCHCLAHVQCFVGRHPTLFSASTKATLQGQLQGLDERQELATGQRGEGSWDGPLLTTATAEGMTGEANGTLLSHSSYDGIAYEPTIPPSPITRTPRRAPPPTTSSSTAAGGQGSQPDGLTPDSAGATSGTWIAEDDIGNGQELCTFGPAARCVLPPMCVRSSIPAPAAAPAAAPIATPLSRANSGDAVPGMMQRAVSRGRRTPLGQGLVAAAAAAAQKWPRRSSRDPSTGNSAPAVISTGPAAATADSASEVAGDSDSAPTPHASVAAATPAGGIGTPRPASDREKVAARQPWWKRIRDQSRWSGYSLSADLPAGVQPLLVFINLKSGPQLGRTLHLQLLQLLHPLQVVELPREDPLQALRFFAPAWSQMRVLVMGGDGTVGWVLQSMDTLAAEQPPGWTQPPVGIMPMGTGNDLARCLGWGASPRLQNGLTACLLEVAGGAAHPVPLDRWSVAITPPIRHVNGTSQAPPGSLKRLLSNTRHSVVAAAGAAVAVPAQVVNKTLNNYMGIGIDAKVALQFHQARSAFPFWFQSQLGNKVWYTGLGAPDVFRRSCVDLHQKLTLECDGVKVPVPADTQGLVVINIPCHMGGVYLWESGLPAPPIPLDNNADPAVRKTAGSLTSNKRMGLADGLIEVVAIGGVAHMGRLAVGLARAQRLAQCSRVVITTDKPLPMQVDGEPWMQEPCTVSVAFKNQTLVLRRVGGGPAQRVVAAVQDALDSSQRSGVISATQKAALAKEVGRRLEAVLA